MVVTEKVHLPTLEELECEEVALSGPVLKAGAQHMGKYCEEINDEFMQCRKEYGMRECVPEGKEVTACTLEFFRKLKKTCYRELQQYSNCIDKSSSNFNIHPCRKTQAAFDQCVLENFGIDRPIYWYFTRPRVFSSKRRPAPPIYPIIEFPDQPVSPVAEEGLPPPENPKFFTRFWWWT